MSAAGPLFVPQRIRRAVSRPDLPAISSVRAISGGSGLALPDTLPTFTGEDRLRVVSLGAVAGVILTVSGRRIGGPGEILPFSFAHSASADRTATTTDLELGSGWLVSLTVRVTAGTVAPGGCYVAVEIIRGTDPAAIVLDTLLAGYVSTRSALAWPYSGLSAPDRWRGRLVVVTGTDPAAGVEITETVPTGAAWRLLSLGATLVTGIAAPARTPTLVLDDGATSYYTGVSTQASGASTTKRYFWSVNGSELITIAPIDGTGRLPSETVLLAGHRLRTLTDAFAAADNWGAPTLYVEEWIAP